MSISWRAGFFRVWIILTTLWVIGIGAVALSDTSIPSLMRPCSTLRGYVLDATKQPLGDAAVQQCDAVWATEREALAFRLLVPPAVLLLGGIALSWMLAGFRPRHRA